jgi:hypothetical protein
MVECIILYRLAGNVHAVMTIASGEDRIFIFSDLDAAVTYANSNSLFKSGQADYQIVELDEL